MSEAEKPLSKQDELAVAIALGKSIAVWARQNEVPKSTAYKWAKDLDVRRQADDCRRRYLERTLGWLSVHSMWAVKGFKQLGDSAESESVQLRARRAVLHDLLKVSDYANLEHRVAEMEEEIRANQANAVYSA